MASEPRSTQPPPPADHPPVRRPTLLDRCALAATSAETRFRIDAPPPAPRASRVIALDVGAEAIVRRVATARWGGAHFLTYDAATAVAHGDGDTPDVALRTTDGARVQLSDELADADMVIMIATEDDGAEAAAAIGEACYRRGIMTGGVVFGDHDRVRPAVSALRPHAQVLLVSNDEDDVPAVLSALRA